MGGIRELSYKEFLRELNIVDSELAKLAYDLYVSCRREQGSRDVKS